MHQDARILNPRLAAAIVGLGHGQTIVIADAGLPVPPGVEVLDLALTVGVPSFVEALLAVSRELVVDHVTIAREMGTERRALREKVAELFATSDVSEVPHEDLKAMVRDAVLVVRTGECTPYANAILSGGVAF